MLPIPEISDLDLAFPTSAPLPDWNDIPEEFRQHNGTRFNKIASLIFFKGGRLVDYGLSPKSGIDPRRAFRAIQCCLGSFEPSHEHKEAGVAFMLSEWFEMTEDVTGR